MILVGGELQKTGRFADEMAAGFRRMDVAAMGITQNVQGLGGYMRASTASLDQFAARMQPVATT